MPEWLQTNGTALQITATTLAGRLLLAWLCGWLVAVLARRGRAAEAEDTLTLTLVLMSVLIAMATQIIGDNIARAFSLVGALSIVRFRTAVPAPRDVAFVLAAVVVGMAIGAGQILVTALGLLTLALVTHFNSPSDAAQRGNNRGVHEPALESDKRAWRLTLCVGLAANANWEAELERLTERFILRSVETARRGGAMEIIYFYLPRPDQSAIDIISALNALPAVESVSVKQN